MRRIPVLGVVVVAAFVTASVVVACSSFSSGDDGSPADGSTPDDAGSAADALDVMDAGNADSSVQPACDPSAPFGDPALVQGEINSTNHNDDWIWILADGRTAYFSSDRLDGGYDYRIFSATRPDALSAWGSATPEPIVDDAGLARDPVLAPDALTLYFVRGVGGPLQVWIATRAALTDPFGVPVLAAQPLNVGNGSSRNIITWVSAIGGSVLLASDRGGDLDVYRSEISPTGFSTPTVIDSLSSTSDDLAIFTPDELQAFVSSNRPNPDAGVDASTTGGLDLHYSRRASKSDPWPTPTRLDGLNTKLDETATYVSPDGCTLYFKRVTEPYGALKVFVASRPM